EQAVRAAEEQAHREAERQGCADREDLVGLPLDQIVGATDLDARRTRGVRQLGRGSGRAVGDLAGNTLRRRREIVVVGRGWAGGGGHGHPPVLGSISTVRPYGR